MKKDTSLVPISIQNAMQRIGKQIEVANKLLQRIDKKNELAENQIVCPRCLGKGFVDRNDIERLGNTLYWSPGKCAYCNTIGFVPKSKLHKISPNDPNVYWTGK